MVYEWYSIKQIVGEDFDIDTGMWKSRGLVYHFMTFMIQLACSWFDLIATENSIFLTFIIVMFNLFDNFYI